MKAKQLLLLTTVSFSLGTMGATTVFASEGLLRSQYLSETSASDNRPVTAENELVERLKMETRAMPGVPGDSEVLTDVFRSPIGTATSLLTDKMLQITPASNGQRGAIWSKDKLNLKRDFSMKAFIYLGESTSNAADGITFTLQNDERMATNETSVIGDTGMGIGAYSNRSGGAYVHNAVSVEFDTYFNNGSNNRMDREVGENGKRGHLGIVVPKANNNSYTGEHKVWDLSPVYLSNNTWREMEISWDATSQTLSYNVSGVGKNSYRIANLNDQFKGETVYWGFTASTGSFNAQNVIAISELPQKFEQFASVENLTKQSGIAETAIAELDDIIRYMTKVEADAFVNTDHYQNSFIRLPIKEGLEPKKESVKINGQAISQNRIELKDGYLYVSDTALTTAGDLTVSIEYQVTSTVDDTTISSSFDYLDSNGNVLATSNQVSIRIPKAELGTLIVYYHGDDQQNISPPFEQTKKVGTAFKESPLTIEGYQIIGEQPAIEGTFRPGVQEITFNYKKIVGAIELISYPSQMNFGTFSIREFQKTASVDETKLDSSLIVKDTRTTREKWSLTANVVTELSNGDDKYTGALKYMHNNQELTLGPGPTTIYENEGNSNEDIYDITKSWGLGEKQEGLKIRLDSPKVPKASGSYTGTIRWVLRSTID